MAGPPQVLLGYPPAVQTHHHVHPLQHLHVVVDLKGVVKVEEVLHLVVGYGALDNSLLARVHYDERQLNGGVGGGGPASPLRLLVALHQVFESNLLKDEILELLGFCLDSLYSLRLDNKEGILQYLVIYLLVVPVTRVSEPSSFGAAPAPEMFFLEPAPDPED